MPLISHHQAVRIGTRNLQFQFKFMSSHALIGRSSLTKNPNKDNTKRCVLPLDPSLSASRINPRPPHIVLRRHVRLRRQKLPRHRRMPAPCSPMQRRVSILRRASAVVRQAPPLSAQVRASPPAPAAPSAPHLHSTETEREGGRGGERGGERGRDRDRDREAGGERR